MLSAHSFPQWIARIRDGEPFASAQLVDFYAPVLRRVIAARLSHRRLGRLIDPLDVSQIVFCSFFARLSCAWPSVETLDQLTALLITMARNRLRDELRRHRAGRRDHRRIEEGRDRDLLQVEARGQSPSEAADYREFYERLLRNLTGDEWSLLEDRLAGRTWASIAVERGDPAALLRKKLNRAVLRVRLRFAQNRSGTPPAPVSGGGRRSL